MDTNNEIFDVGINAQRQRRRDKRKNRQNKHSTTTEDDGDEDNEHHNDNKQSCDNHNHVTSQKEDDFIKKVQVQHQKEEELLQMISGGLNGLYHSAAGINHTLYKQQALIDDVDQKIDREQEKIKQNNKNMDKMIKK